MATASGWFLLGKSTFTAAERNVMLGMCIGHRVGFARRDALGARHHDVREAAT